MSKTLLRHTLITKIFLTILLKPYFYTLSLYENSSFIIFSPEKPTHDIFPHPTHSMLTPLPIVYQTLSYRIMSPYHLVKQEVISLSSEGSTYNDKKSSPGSI